jgi:response regulator of citrate/malate metabolism
MFIKVSSFETGEKSMRRFLQVMPEFVILDYYLDSKDSDADDGIKILDWIKKENNETNVIMLTCDDHIDIALESFKHGASDYIVKTETQFKKINYSLLNLFKIMEEKNYAKKYKWLLVALFIIIGMIAAGIVAFRLF